MTKDRIRHVYDNGGRTFDRYRVQFALDGMEDGELLVGPTGNVPNGVCMWAYGVYPQREDETEVMDLHFLPRPVRRAIANELRLYRACGRERCSVPNQTA